MSRGVLHFVTEDEAINFIERANNLGIEWIPGRIVDMGTCYAIEIEALPLHSRKALYDLFYNS